ncbi:MAG: LysR family transcriptional regulator [Pseudomonadota bacterium]|nr:LysR family transcriptional regulator [Pseudomonadota bacterium]
MPNKSDPTFDDLAIFLAVCSAGGFRTAARQLGLSPSHVSETITRIEIQLGVPLLARTTRSVTPTEAGRALADRLMPLFAETRAALDDVSLPGAAVRGRLKLNVTGAVMVDILPPLIDRFILRHPAVRIEIEVEDRLVDITAAGCDAGIRYGEHLAQDVIAVPIGPRRQTLALAAAPDYLARRGLPTHPREVVQHDCVRMRFSSGALTAWMFEKNGEALTLDPPGRLVVGVDAAPAAIGFAAAGHGLVCTFKNWLDADFASGRLMPVLLDWWPQFDGPQLYFTSRRMTAPLRAFVDMIAEERVKD